MSDYITKKCTICGKEIVIRSADSWAYKVQNGPGGMYRFFCRYSHMQEWKRQHPQIGELRVRRLLAEAEAEPADKKAPTKRRETALDLVDEIQAGRNPIDYLKAAGYKNPYEAYDAVRHYAACKMRPEVGAILKPIRELRKDRIKARQ